MGKRENLRRALDPAGMRNEKKAVGQDKSRLEVWKMTTMEIISQLNSLVDDRKSFIDDNGQGDDIYLNDIAALTAAIEAISTSNGDKLYTAFDVIKLVQETVSEEICSLDDGETLVAYEIERGIIGKLVKEDGCETNV